MLRAYRIFCLLVILLGALVLPFYLAPHLSGFAWLVVLQAALAAGLFAFYLLWTQFMRPREMQRGLRIAGAGLFTLAAAAAALLALDVLRLEFILLRIGAIRFEATLVLACLLLVFAPLYAAWQVFIRPLIGKDETASVKHQYWTAGALFVAFMLLVGPTTYHAVVGQ